MSSTNSCARVVGSERAMVPEVAPRASTNATARPLIIITTSYRRWDVGDTVKRIVNNNN